MIKQVLTSSILIILLIIAVTSIELFSQTFQKCMSGVKYDKYASENDKQNAADQKNSAIFKNRPVIFVTCTGDFLDKHSPGITALATVVIAAFTITLWRSTSITAQLTKQELIIDKGAFISPKDLSPFWEIDQITGQYHWRFRPIWENTGDTFARRTRFYTDCELRNGPLPVGFDFSKISYPSGNGFIGPKTTILGGIAPQSPRPAISPQDIADAQLGRKYIYIWGWIYYFDVFEKTPPRMTRFCWFLVTSGDPFSYHASQRLVEPNALRFQTVHHSEGNGADDEAKLQSIF